jgi:hypothetical protein
MGDGVLISSSEPGLAPRRVLARLTGAVGGAVLVTAGATAVVISVTHHPLWWSGWTAALLVSLMAAAVSLAAVAAGMLGGLQGMAYGFLAGAFARVLVSIGGAIAAISIVHTPPAPTLLLMLPLFFVQLATETIVLSRALLGPKTKL